MSNDQPQDDESFREPKQSGSQPEPEIPGQTSRQPPRDGRATQPVFDDATMNPAPYLHTGPGATSTDLDGTTIPVRTDPLIGKVLDNRYEIEAHLGQGGMGTVYRARHTGLGKPVAVKVLHCQLLLDPTIVTRFEHEIKVMSTLSHPNLITIQDNGITELDTPYFVMEYLTCQSLEEVLDESGYLSAARARAIFVQIADALVHAHSKGVIHRDLKPANVLIVKSQGADHVKLVDLGIAKLMDPRDMTVQQKLTQTGEVFGSPQYMSPEQCLSEAQDARTDVYSLGCVMYEALTGELPIVRRTAVETIFGHINEKPPRFSEANPDLVFTKGLKQFETIVLKCLEKAREDRYQTMDELLRALQSISDSGKSAPRFESSKPKKRKPVVVEDPDDEPDTQKKKIVMAVVGLVVAGALACMCLGFVLFQFLNKSPHFSQFTQKSDTSVSSGNPSISQEEALKLARLTNEGKQFSPEAWEIWSRSYSREKIEFEPRANDSSIVKVFSVYMGKPTGNFENVIPGRINITVRKQKKPLNLVLHAFMPTTWSFTLQSPSVKIERVILIGMFPQKVDGLPAGIPTTEIARFKMDQTLDRSRKNPIEPFYFTYASGNDVRTAPEFKKLKSAITRLTGDQIRSFEGIYTTDRFSVD